MEPRFDDCEWNDPLETGVLIAGRSGCYRNHRFPHATRLPRWARADSRMAQRPRQS